MNRFDIALGRPEDNQIDPLLECLKEVEAMYIGDKRLAKELKMWLDMPEENAMATAHHGLGAHIRNEWKLWSGEGTLVEYFAEMGIIHPDDMSGIILTSFHRWKNDRPIELQQQVKHYIDFWKKEGWRPG